jgi:hypothetical protein
MKKKFRPLLAAFIIIVAAHTTNAQWIHISVGLPSNVGVHSVVSNGATLLAVTNGGVFSSTDNGMTWKEMTTGLVDKSVTAIAIGGTTIFAGTTDEWGNGGVFRSENNGSSWTSAGLSNETIMALTVFGTDLYAGTWSHGVFRSTDQGIGWTAVNEGLQNMSSSSSIFQYVRPVCFVWKGTKLFTGTYSEGVFYTDNYGKSWTNVCTGLRELSIGTLIMNGNNLFAGVTSFFGTPILINPPSGRVYLFDDSGSIWIDPNMNFRYHINAFAVSGTKLFAGTENGVFLTTDNGAKWSAVNTGLTDTLVYALSVSGTYLIAGTQTGIYRRPLDELITSVEKPSTDEPLQFTLQQNFPNPFNPSTTIKYQLPATAIVHIEVFDLLGREIAILVNEIKQPGTYSVQWNASDMSSGIYFYRMQAGACTDTKKLLLLR